MVARWYLESNARTCHRAGFEAMPPRRQLRRLWVTLRLLFLGIGLATAITILRRLNDGLPIGSVLSYAVSSLARPQQQTEYTSEMVDLLLAVSFLTVGLVFTPATRGSVHRWLGSLGGKLGNQTQEAAAVASLLGTRSAAETYQIASKTFRALRLGELTREELENSAPDPAMHAKSTAAALGTVQAFVSHSWSDDGAAKFDALHQWAGGDGEVLIWLDKACIDQRNIDACLACLPVFLSGCQSLLCLTGPTYTQRLWCVMELFVFMRMGGGPEDVYVYLLEDGSGPGDDLGQQLARFDAGKAQCFLDGDRQRLLAVIDATFGTLAPFNALMRKLLLRRSKLAVSVSKLALRHVPQPV